MKYVKKGLAAACFLLITAKILAQLRPETIKHYITQPELPGNIKLPYLHQVKIFYDCYQYRAAWMNNDSARQQLLTSLFSAEEKGLPENAYQYETMQSFRSKPPRLLTQEDSVVAEFQLTDAYIHYLDDLLYGNTVPELGYNGLDYRPDCISVATLLAASLSDGNFAGLEQQFENTTTEYRAIKNKLNQLLVISKDSTLRRQTPVSSLSAIAANTPLFYKLWQYGCISSPDTPLPEEEMKQKLKEAQRLFSLPADGILRANLVRELNVPVAVRIEQLKRALNTCRWMHCLLQQNKQVVVVNIPSANLLVYQCDSVVLESRIIVGKQTTPTPLFSTCISEVILYPYWTVPHSIATRELLPMFKKNPKFMEANNFSLLNASGRVVNPASVNWQALNSRNFPYTIRQSTGCDNALGIIKLNFYTPYGVYLHDTPFKIFFGMNNRYFSHGCMRVEKIVPLAHVVLAGNSIAIDTITSKGNLLHQQPVIIPATTNIPLLVLYNTAWVDTASHVRFYPDVYRKQPE